MTGLAETLATAFVLSGLAAVCLELLPHAPPRLRFALAAAGLAVWLVPWGFIHIAVPASGAFVAPLALASPVASVAESTLYAAGALAYALGAAAAIGVALLVGDCLALRRCTRRWRATSRRADELRALLPPELAAAAAEIRLVANSDVAAASGYFRPTIWIGDRHAGQRLELVVVHEMWHVLDRDPLWIAAIATVRRLYWWNPLVARLARRAFLMMESICDHRSAERFGKPRYAAELAALVLAGAARQPGLCATLQTANLDVQRVRLLGRPLRVRARDFVLLATLGAGAAATAMSGVLEPITVPAPAASQAAATAVARGAPVLDELLDTYAYTPQQHVGDGELEGRRTEAR